jgi:hypothetical protein
MMPRLPFPSENIRRDSAEAAIEQWRREYQERMREHRQRQN